MVQLHTVCDTNIGYQNKTTKKRKENRNKDAYGKFNRGKVSVFYEKCRKVKVKVDRNRGIEKLSTDIQKKWFQYSNKIFLLCYRTTLALLKDCFYALYVSSLFHLYSTLKRKTGFAPKCSRNIDTQSKERDPSSCLELRREANNKKKKMLVYPFNNTTHRHRYIKMQSFYPELRGSSCYVMYTKI